MAIVGLSLLLALRSAPLHRQMRAIKALREIGAVVTVSRGPTFRSAIKAVLGLDTQTIRIEMVEKESDLQRDDKLQRSEWITDNHVTNLADVHDATEIVLISDHITRRSLASLSTLPKLERLELAAHGLAEEAIGELRRCAQLVELVLVLDSIGNQGLWRLAMMRQLRSLCIVAPTATDQGVLQLGALSGLRSLVIYSDCLTPNGVSKLETMLPRCEIVLERMGLQMVEMETDEKSLGSRKAGANE